MSRVVIPIPQPKKAITTSLSTLVKDILSSNIQYLNHQIKCITRPLQFLVTEDKYSKNNAMLVQDMESIFHQYERFSRKKWLLTHVLSLLTETNALLILNMLSDNCLCEFDIEEIEFILNGS